MPQCLLSSKFQFFFVTLLSFAREDRAKRSGVMRFVRLLPTPLVCVTDIMVGGSPTYSVCNMQTSVGVQHVLYFSMERPL